MPKNSVVRDAIRAVPSLSEERNDEEVDAAIDTYRILKRQAAELATELALAEDAAIQLMRKRGIKKSPGYGTLVTGNTLNTDYAAVTEKLMTKYPALWKKVTGRVLVQSRLEKAMLESKTLVEIVKAHTAEKPIKPYIRLG